MEIVERNKLVINNSEVKDELLEELLINHMKPEINQKDIDDEINKLKQRFLEKGYSEDELKAEVVNEIIIYSQGYTYTINVYVYPKTHPDIYLERKVSDASIIYMSTNYEKQRNELGKQISLHAQLLLLKSENEELKKRVEELKKEITELEEELEKCREGEEDP